jgi:hypothetical protein
MKVGEYLGQYYHIGKKTALTGEMAAIRNAHWINFGAGPDETGKMVSHPGEVWFRDDYKISSPIRKVNYCRNVKAKIVDGIKRYAERDLWAEYFDDDDLKPLSKFQKYDAPVELEEALIKDLHKLSMSGLPSHQRHLYPIPEGCVCRECVEFQKENPQGCQCEYCDPVAFAANQAIIEARKLKLAKEEAQKQKSMKAAAKAAECALAAAGFATFEYKEALSEVVNKIAKPKIKEAAAQAHKAHREAQHAYDIALLQEHLALENKPIFDAAQTEAAARVVARRRKQQVNILFSFDS